MTPRSTLIRLDRRITPPSTANVELDAFRFAGEPARAVVSGSAGAGKTTLLRELAALLAEEGTTTIALRDATDVAQVPADAVLFVDDAHLLSDDRVAELAARAADPDAGLVIAMRSWPARAGVITLGLQLEHSRPAVLLGDVSRPRLRADAPPALGPCEEAILQLTGGIAWLVHESLAVHDERDCADDPTHRVLQEAVRPRIIHRLMSTRPRLRRLIDDVALGLPPLAVPASPDGADSADRAADAAPGSSGRRGPASHDDDLDALLAEGYAEGLLTSDGRPAPIVVDTVRAITPATRVVELIATASAATLRDERLIDCLDGVTDPRAAAALSERAHAEAPRDPELASDLLDRALASGADPDALAEVRAHVAWSLGRLDDAAALVDGLLDGRDTAPDGLLTDLAATVWAQRGMMSLADDTYRAHGANGSAARTRAYIAALGAGRVDAGLGGDEPDRAGGAPSASTIAHELIARGLRATLTLTPGAALADLQRGSELYTASGITAPTVELPAVIAAAAAVGVGDLKSAESIIDDALRGGQGGTSRQSRLHLWASWIALQREHPADARASLARATSGPGLAPRDDAFAATIAVGLARRYDDTAGLAAAWEEAQPHLVRLEPDLYSLLPLGELVIASARLGDATSLQHAFERGLRIVAGLGEPPIWAAPLHWAGIQRGILLSQPDALAPHARALVAAASHTRLAARMAQAGRVWTSVLSGSVDPDAVEAAATGLATVGLAWDGARLAGHGAGRSDDRRIIARLLACARELHPRESVRTADDAPQGAAHEGSAGFLSEREREVAELVLQGKTYAEIGDAIFISPRTAEHHIAHIRRRLDATSRSDLLAKLRVALEAETRPARTTTGQEPAK